MGSCRSKGSKIILNHEQILIFLGTSSSASIHKALLTEMISLPIFSQNSLRTIVVKLAQIPIFNEDLIKENKIPTAANELLHFTSKAKAIIFITPEYNRAVSPLILNACEWITQISKAKDQSQNAMYGKPIAIMSCSYISQDQVKDIEIMTKTSNVKLFKQSFYVDLKNGQIDLDAKIISPQLKKRLQQWVREFIKFN